MRLIRIKKLFSAVLTLSVAATLLTGCGKTTDSDQPTAEGVYDESGVYHATLPTGVEDSDIFVAPISGVSDDFICGMDISSLIAEENSGVKYYDENGVEQDLFKILADNGINYIRVRVWNDPYDADGNGYGGGNCDAALAATLGARAAAYNMKLNVDFHYSDFWADPSKQMCPKAWEKMTVDEKAQALYDYTVESLTTIIEAGADVGMVQIGNEINHGMAGESIESDVMTLLKQGSQAVRDVSAKYGLDIKIAVHYTNVDNSGDIQKKATYLTVNGLDYDIFGISYYPYWHGTLENMSYVLAITKVSTGKDVMVLETGFPYTGEDGDGSGNNISEDDITGEFICSPQSQANSVWDIMNEMASIGGLGVFYWEGAWIPVGSSYEENSPIWKEYGSGWASVYAGDYDPNDAGLYYGGCSWENQAFFDFEGNVLPSLGVFKYFRYGTNTEEKLEFLSECTISINQGDDLVMPEGVYGIYNDRSKNRIVPTTWDETDVANVNTSRGGEYKVKGVTEDGTNVVCTVKVEYLNLLTNSSFEEGLEGWSVSHENYSNPTDVQTKAADAMSGEKAFHWWSGSEDPVFNIEQTVTASEDGIYNAFASVQGGDMGDNSVVKLYILVNGEEVATSSNTLLGGWKVWKNPSISGVEIKAGDEITVGMTLSCAKGGWGTMDDFCLYKD